MLGPKTYAFTGELIKVNGEDLGTLQQIEDMVDEIDALGADEASVIIRDEGVLVAGGPHTTIDFVGVGVSVANGGDGTATVTISAGGGGGGDFDGQVFAYSVVGDEPDLSALVITLPVEEASTAYLVFPAMATVANHVTMSVATSSKTVALFVLSLSAPATAGDVFSFLISQPT